MILSRKRLRFALDYNPETGVFTWKNPTAKQIKRGDEAGSIDEDGYIRISLDGLQYTGARLAFFWMTGRWPDPEVDHKDGNPSNNRWHNLREATHAQNGKNLAISSRNKTGYKGVVKFNRKGIWSGKWRAQIGVDGKIIHLGLFDCPAAAAFKYIVASDRHFGVFARTS